MTERMKSQYFKIILELALFKLQTRSKWGQQNDNVVTLWKIVSLGEVCNSFTGACLKNFSAIKTAAKKTLGSFDGVYI